MLIQHGLKGRVYSQKMVSDLCRGWILCEAEKAEHVPNMPLSIINTATTKSALFKRYQMEMKKRGYAANLIASEILFRKVWQKNCDHIFVGNVPRFFQGHRDLVVLV